MKLENDCKCVVCEFNDGTGTCYTNPQHDECGICITRTLKRTSFNVESLLIAEHDRNEHLVKDFTENYSAPKYLEDVVKLSPFPPGVLGQVE